MYLFIGTVGGVHCLIDLKRKKGGWCNLFDARTEI